MLHKIKVIYKVLHDYLLSLGKPKNAVFLNTEDTILYALNNRISLIRYGDGEFGFFEKRGVSYQVYEDNLENDLLNICRDFCNNDANYFLCMPRSFFNSNGFQLLKKKRYLTSWASSRYMFKKLFDINVTYGDAFCFSQGMDTIYKALWENDFLENVVFVHNDIKYYNDFVQKYNFINCKYVKIPNKNSYQFIHQIEQDIKNNVTSINNTVILVSAGPAAKPIVRDLSNCGLWAIDTGHCWCDPLRDIE